MDPLDDIIKFDNIDNTDLMHLCHYKATEIRKADISVLAHEIGRQNKFGITALMYLCNHSKITIDSIKFLNVEMNKKDSNMHTALMYHCRLNYPRIDVLVLLKSEIGNVDYVGRTALMHFFESEKNQFKKNTIYSIYNIMKDEIGKKCFLGRTALMRYMYRKHIQVGFIDMLTDEIGMQDYNGNTALILYLIYNPKPSICVIKRLNKEYAMSNSFGITPLMIINEKMKRKPDNKELVRLNQIKSLLNK